jgi:hypothetical protein
LLPRFKLAEQNAVFCWHDTHSFQHVFGYSTPRPSGKVNPPWFHPLSRSTGLEDLGIEDFSSPKPTDPDPTDPAPASVQADTAAALTLADAVAVLNARPGSMVHADVDAAVAAKPVTLAGTDNASANEVLHALANVYGLRLADALPGSSIKITLPDVAPPSDLAALPLSLRQALPEPLVRAAHMDRMVAAEQEFDDFWMLPRDSKPSIPASSASGVEETSAELERAIQQRKRAISGNADYRAGLARIKQAQATLPMLRLAAIRRLRTLVEPKLQAKPDGVAFAALGESEHEIVATIFLIESTQVLAELPIQPVPATVLHFDQSVLGGGFLPNAQPPSFNMMFYMLGPNGSLATSGMGIGVPYDENHIKYANR